jgi:phosphoglycolate phosphatase-like HAD superfamily hydrolase
VTERRAIRRSTRLAAFALAALAALVALAARAAASPAADPLPSWNDGAAKRSIVKFVTETTREGSAGFIPLGERIATFDNDGTLWAEQPMYFQFLFGTDRIKALAPQHPEWRTTEPYKSILEGQVEKALAQGDEAVLSVMMVTHAGMTTAEFDRVVREWLEAAKHPRFHQLYTRCVYQPMIELLGYMRANGFKTFIVSGGGVEFMRAFAEKVYGIPPEQVVGSSGDTKYELRPDGPVLVKLPQVAFVDDGPGKAEGIQRYIGLRPAFAFGNSDGDQQMLEWTAAGEGLRFCGLVHHTDGEREWAYDRNSRIGHLDKAWDEAVAKGWILVDMKKDWNKVFAFEK